MPEYYVGVNKAKVDPSMAPEVEPSPSFGQAEAALVDYVERQRRKGVLVERLEPMTYHAPKHSADGRYVTHGWWRVPCRFSCLQAHTEDGYRPADVVHSLYYYSSQSTPGSKYQWKRDPGSRVSVTPVHFYRLEGPYPVPGTTTSPYGDFQPHYWLYLDRTVEYEDPGRWVVVCYGKNLGVLSRDPSYAGWNFNSFVGALSKLLKFSELSRKEAADAVVEQYDGALKAKERRFFFDISAEGEDSDPTPTDRVRDAHYRLDSLAASVSYFIDWISDETFPAALDASMLVGVTRDPGIDSAGVRRWLEPLASTARRLAHDQSYLELVFGVLPTSSDA